MSIKLAETDINIWKNSKANIIIPMIVQFLACFLLFVLQQLSFRSDTWYTHPFNITNNYVFVAFTISLGWFLLIMHLYRKQLCKTPVPKKNWGVSTIFLLPQIIILIVYGGAHVGLSAYHSWIPSVVTLLIIGFTMSMGFDKFRYWLLSKAAFVLIFSISYFMLPNRWGGGFISLTPPFLLVLIFACIYLIFLEFIVWVIVKLGSRISRKVIC